MGALAEDILVDVSHRLLKAFLQNLRRGGFKYLLTGVRPRLLGDSAAACADEGFHSRFVPDDGQSSRWAYSFRNTVQGHVQAGGLDEGIHMPHAARVIQRLLTGV